MRTHVALERVLIRQVKGSPNGPDALYDLGMWDESSKTIKGSELMNFYQGLIDDFPIVTIEDAHSALPTPCTFPSVRCSVHAPSVCGAGDDVGDGQHILSVTVCYFDNTYCLLLSVTVCYCR